MAAIGDTLTISVFIALIIGALCFYLFTRIKQVEKKVALMEGILLDLKTATEDSFPNFPAPSPRLSEEEDDDDDDEEPFIPMLAESSGGIESEEVSFAGGMASGDIGSAETRTIDLSELPAAEEEEDAASSPTVQVNKVAEGSATDLEAKSVAELAAMARAKGISGTGKMRKQQLIEVLKASESITNAAPIDGPDGIDAKSSLIEGTSLLSSPL